MNGKQLDIVDLASLLTRQPFRLVTTIAKLKTKKIVGFEANEVKHVI